MPQRHSKNNNDLAFFTYDEKRKLVSLFTLLCLSALYPGLLRIRWNFLMSEVVGVSCREPGRKLAAHAGQQKQEKEEEEERLMLQKARELDAFDQQNHGPVPQYNDKNYNRDKNGFHGANSVKATSYEEEALRTMKAFWLPSATPDAPAKVEAPSTSTTCPEGKKN
ncbi:hypothetical protein HAX54_020476 [Datura stramonium]|uniref:Uncharacterized protein n=1 Tax=Datura stramonium TaxID=4076 RepID=A0ABS8S4R1_DATST|nr:hypothetical protein [Datura stramonium]